MPRGWRLCAPEGIRLEAYQDGARLTMAAAILGCQAGRCDQCRAGEQLLKPT